VQACASFTALDETHRQIVQMLADLERLPSLLSRPDGEAEAAALAEGACRFFNGAARQHHETEETFVFPSLLDGADADLLALVRRLQQDHHWIEEDWLELEPHLQAVAQGWRDDHVAFLRAALPEFTALQHEHIELEESVIYPEARQRQRAPGTPA
jgi:hemerythrin-like domain-containing protein